MDIKEIIREEIRKIIEGGSIGSGYYSNYPDFLDPQFNPGIGAYPPVGMHAYGTLVREESGISDRYVLAHYGDEVDYEEFGVDEYEAANEAEEIAKNGGVTILRGQELTSILFDTDAPRVIGGLWISHYNDKFSFDIAIDSSYQNMGLSSKLIEAAIQEYNFQKDMHDESGNEFKMEVDVINPKLAKILQNKYGFHVVGQLTQDRVLMSVNENANGILVKEDSLEEDYPEMFKMEEFKTLTSFKERIRYCESFLQRISSGSARIVYKIDDEKVLKLAKNKKGLAQNKIEISYSSQGNIIGDIIAKVFDYDENNLWSEMELARKIKKSDFKRIIRYSWEEYVAAVHNYGIDSDKQLNRGNKLELNSETWEEMWEDEFMHDIFQFIGNYNLPTGDLERLSTYGIVNRGGIDEIVIIDYGLNKDSYTSYYS